MFSKLCQGDVTVIFAEGNIVAQPENPTKRAKMPRPASFFNFNPSCYPVSD